MTGKTILVTGAAGFIGSHTAAALLERGDKVVGLDNLNDYYDPARKRANLSELAGLAGAAERFTFVEGDIRNRALVGELFAKHGFTAVAHLAAMAGVRVSVDDPWLYYDVNLTGTLNLLDASRLHGKPNFVLASTSSAYANTKQVPFIETDAADRPLAPYPASKRSAELLGHSYHHIHGAALLHRVRPARAPRHAGLQAAGRHAQRPTHAAVQRRADASRLDVRLRHRPRRGSGN